MSDITSIATKSADALTGAFLDALIPNGAPLVMLDFPNHRNVGDSAIYLGELAYLRKHHPASRIIWVSSCGLRNWPTLPVFSKNAIILLHGGGNFGDLWPHHQHHRQRVVQHYLHHRIIQLPQSIHFKDGDSQERENGMFSRHPDFHIFVRDEVSMEWARELGIPNRRLAPDMALFLGPVSGGLPTQDCVALLRDDHEKKPGLPPLSLTAETASHGCPAEDWPDEPGSLLLRAFRWTGKYPGRMRAVRPWISERLAARRLKRGIDLLSKGRVVITDRLHGHILCTLMGRPHVVLDNNYGKIANFRQAWNTGVGLCQVASNHKEAHDLARELAKKDLPRRAFSNMGDAS